MDFTAFQIFFYKKKKYIQHTMARKKYKLKYIVAWMYLLNHYLQMV